MPAPSDGLMAGSDGKRRCWWHGNDPDYLRYHDEEWGHPVIEDRRLFEKICLEGFQAGLSWLTILRKREDFRQAFHQFDWEKIVQMTESDIQALLNNKGIIRHRGKIEAVIDNAQKLPALINEFGSFAAYVWSYEPTEVQRPKQFDFETLRHITRTEFSTALSRDLKKRGWKFVGPTICYAFMQSMGIVNDHLAGCFCRPVIEEKRRLLIRP